MTDHTAAHEDLVLPEVSRSTANTIVVELDPEQAAVLARILAHYEVLQLPAAIEPADGYVPEIWHHTLIDLFKTVADEVHVPLLRLAGAGDVEALAAVTQERRS